MKQVRQGDFLLIKADGCDLSSPYLVKEDHPAGEVIVGHGEVTGHMHRVKSFQAEAWKGGGSRYLNLKEPAELTHDEHGGIPLETGIYKIVQQREWTGESARAVED